LIFNLKHEYYNPSTLENDLALIKLDRKVNSSDNVNFICLDYDVKALIGDQIMAIGNNLYYE
jgi:hypothetical protein